MCVACSGTNLMMNQIVADENQIFNAQSLLASVPSQSALCRSSWNHCCLQAIPEGCYLYIESAHPHYAGYLHCICICLPGARFAMEHGRLKARSLEPLARCATETCMWFIPRISVIIPKDFSLVAVGTVFPLTYTISQAYGELRL